MPRYAVSDHFDGKKFFNPGVDNTKGFGSVLKWMMTRTQRPWPEKVENQAVPRLLNPGGPAELGATWIGHATVLLQFGDRNLLTDPVFSERASPVSFAGPTRIRPPGLSYEQLPAIHAVLVSHNHYDHLDLPSLKELNRRFSPLFVVPLGNAEILREQGITNVRELDWWESLDLPGNPAVTITLTPSLHWSSRGPGDRNEALWGAYFIRSVAGRSAYFAGDTGYRDHFRRTRERLGAPDLALLPIGAYEPRWFMKENHMNPDEAVRAHLDLGAAQSIPMHYATFRLTDEGYDEPLQALRTALGAHGVDAERFPVLEVGGSWKFSF